MLAAGPSLSSTPAAWVVRVTRVIDRRVFGEGDVSRQAGDALAPPDLNEQAGHEPAAKHVSTYLDQQWAVSYTHLTLPTTPYV